MFCPGAHLSRTLQSRCKTIAAIWTEFQIAAPGTRKTRPSYPDGAGSPSPQLPHSFFQECVRKGAQAGRLTVGGSTVALRMGENVLGFPALQIEPGPRREESETGLRQFQAAFAREHRVEAFAQRVQMQNVGGRVCELRIA